MTVVSFDSKSQETTCETACKNIWQPLWKHQPWIVVVPVGGACLHLRHSVSPSPLPLEYLSNVNQGHFSSHCVKELVPYIFAYNLHF